MKNSSINKSGFQEGSLVMKDKRQGKQSVEKPLKLNSSNVEKHNGQESRLDSKKNAEDSEKQFNFNFTLNTNESQRSIFLAQNKILKRKKSSNLLNNFFANTNTNQKQDFVIKNNHDKSTSDVHSTIYDQFYSPKARLMDHVTPKYALLNNIIPAKTKASIIETQNAQKTLGNTHGEQVSITQRLNNLKKFYHAEGPLVDKLIIPKTSHQTFLNTTSSRNKQSKKPLNYSHDNLDNHQLELQELKSNDFNQRGLLSPHSSLPTTPYQLISKSTGHSKKPSLQFNNEQPYIEIDSQRRSVNQKENKYGQITERLSPHNHQSMSKTIGSNKPFLQQQQLLQQQQQQHQEQLQMHQQRLLLQQQQQNNFQHSQENIQTAHKKSILHQNEQQLRQARQSLNDFSSKLDVKKQKKQIVLFKNNFQQGTENYFKIEIQNLQEKSGKKFVLCTEYEAHRNYKSDPNQAEKFFIQQIDLMLPQVKEILRLVSTANTTSKDVASTDSYLGEVNNIAASTKNGYLQVLSLLFHAKICFEYRDFVKTINLAKKGKNLAQVYGYMYEKMKIYELIGQAFNALQKYNLSIIYQIKVLRMSWLMLNENHELKAYDQLGKCYYYLGDLEKAYYYHEKMMKGEVERNQAIKQLSNSKLLNREYRNNSDIYRRKKKNDQKEYEYGEEIPEEEEYVSSSDDEFEITVSIKNPTKDGRFDSITTADNDEDPSKDIRFNTNRKGSNQLGWNDKLIMARLKVLQIQRTKEMKPFSKNKSITAADLHQQQVGKVECLMDMKNQEYLQKIFQKRGKATNMQKKYRISHLTPNRTILSYHEAEVHYLKNKNYSSQQDFIPTIDSHNLKRINQLLNKYKILLSETVVSISHTLVNSPIYQNPSKQSSELIQIPKQLHNQESKDFKFKKMQEKETKFQY